MEFLAEYGIFLLKAVTIALAVLFPILMIISSSKGSSSSEKGFLTIKNLSEQFEAMANAVNESQLDSKKQKKFNKELKKKKKKELKSEDKDSVFVLNFNGDVQASEVEKLKHEINAIIVSEAKCKEVVLKVESGGGSAYAYGLCAAELKRLIDSDINLTVCVDKVAASGGYLMSCVASKIVAAPWALVGSIGVIAQMPNIHKLLKKNLVDFEMHTAGEFKRTLTVFGENTEEGREKFKSELEDLHIIFKDFVKDIKLGKLIPIPPELVMRAENVFWVQQGEKWRRINDLRLANINKVLRSFQMPSPNDVLRLIDPDWEMISYDFKSCYYQFPISQLQQMETATCFEFLEEPDIYYYFVATGLPFGLNAVCRTVHKALKGVATTLGKIFNCTTIAYLDDCVAALHKKNETRAYKEEIRNLFLIALNEFGLWVNKKCQTTPTQSIEFLGCIIDIREHLVSPKPARIKKLHELLTEIIKHNRISIKAARSLAGIIRSLDNNQMVNKLMARTLELFISDKFRMFSDNQSGKRTKLSKTKENKQFEMTYEFLEILFIWLNAVKTFTSNQRPDGKNSLTLKNRLPFDFTQKRGAKTLFSGSDASDALLGFCAVFNDKVIFENSLPIPIEFQNASSTFRELLGIRKNVFNIKNLLEKNPEIEHVTILTDSNTAAWNLLSNSAKIQRDQDIIYEILSELKSLKVPFSIKWVRRDRRILAHCDSNSKILLENAHRMPVERVRYLAAQFNLVGSKVNKKPVLLNHISNPTDPKLVHKGKIPIFVSPINVGRAQLIFDWVKFHKTECILILPANAVSQKYEFEIRHKFHHITCEYSNLFELRNPMCFKARVIYFKN